jgi:hypothetical protein
MAARAGQMRAASSVGPTTENEERRLVEVAHAIDPQRDPVAGRADRLRDHGVKPLGRIQERGGAEPEQVHQADRKESEAERDPRHENVYPGRVR